MKIDKEYSVEVGGSTLLLHVGTSHHISEEQNHNIHDYKKHNSPYPQHLLANY
jgi:hypothetical protein